MRLSAFALAALLSSGLAFAVAAETPLVPPPPPAPAAQPEVDPEQAKQDAFDNEVICRTEDETGSRLRKKKICMTRKEWLSSAQDAQDATSGLQRSGVPPKQPGG